MKFNVIIGNPPYQEMTGGGTTTESSMPLYHYFIEKAMDICDGYVTMIIPSRWMSGGKSVLDDFRRRMVECGSLQSIYNFEKSQDVFPTVNIAGGVQYLLLNKEYNSDLVEFHNCKLENNQIVYEYTVRNIGEYKYIKDFSKLSIKTGKAQNKPKYNIAKVQQKPSKQVFRPCIGYTP